MRVAAIELFVHVARSQLEPSDAVMHALAADTVGRNEQALRAIEEARRHGPDVILCPGWTFVEAAPTSLPRIANGATVIFEVLPLKPPRGQPAGKLAVKSTSKGSGNAPRWNSFVLEQGQVRECPRQAVTRGPELDDPENAQTLARTLMSPERLVGKGRLVVCGEVNVMRFRAEGHNRQCIWEPQVARAGLSDRAFVGLTIFNPAHTPSSNYMSIKRRRGPWKKLVTTANQLDFGRLNRRTLPQPTQAYVDEAQLEPERELALRDSGRLVVFSL